MRRAAPHSLKHARTPTPGWHRRPLVGFDLETTSLDPETARIVTGCVVRWGGGRPNTPWTWLSDVGGEEIPAEATAVHGYTTAAAHGAGRPAAVVVSEIVTALENAVVAGLPLVAMCAPYDLTVVDREARRHGVRPLVDRVDPLVLDPRVLDRHVDARCPGRQTLADLCRHYVVHLAAAHSCEADAVAACRVVWKIANRHRWLGRVPLPELHARQVRWSAEQADDLRGHFARTPGREHLAAGVRAEWPLLPAAPVARAGGTPWR